MNDSKTNTRGQVRTLTVFLSSLVIASAGCGQTTAPATTPEPAPATAPAEAPATSPFEYVAMETSKGTITLVLDRGAAPVTVANFLRYVDEDFYANTIFHRVIAGFMIQGGGFGTDTMKKATHDGIYNEWKNGLKNRRGSISMARVGGDPNSGTSQFFLSVVDNPGLDQRQRDGAAYAVFGTVIDGMNVVDAIRDTPTGTGALNGGQRPDVPVEAIVMTGMHRVKEDTLSAAARAQTAAFKVRYAEARSKIMENSAHHAEMMAHLAGDNVQTTDSGMRYVVLDSEDGAKPVATDSVTVIYSGWFPDGHKFDSSLDHPTGPTASFPLNRVIAGWTEGVALMSIGSRYVFEIPGDLAYGPNGRSGIPPNATLIFEIELKSID